MNTKYRTSDSRRKSQTYQMSSVLSSRYEWTREYKTPDM